MRNRSAPLCFIAFMLAAAAALWAMLPPLPSAADGINYGASTVTLSGDCAGSGSTAISVTCLKTNGTSFAASATTDTTNASNISSGALNLARLAYNPILGPTGYQSGPYYTQLVYNPTTSSLVANRLYAMPFFAPVGKTFTKISFYTNTTGTATECELGNYADNGSTAPGTLGTDAGETAPTSNTTQNEITGTSIAIVPGLNWLAMACNGTVTVEAVQGTISGLILGWSSGTAAYEGQYVSWSFSAGGLPNPFGTSTPALSAGPNVYLRY